MKEKQTNKQTKTDGQRKFMHVQLYYPSFTFVCFRSVYVAHVIECLSYKLKLRTLLNNRHIIYKLFVLRI